MIYEVYKLGIRNILKTVDCNNPKEAICLALQMKSNLVNITKVDPYMANYCVKCVNGKRNTANYYYITFNSSLMDAREYGFNLDSTEISIRIHDYHYFCSFPIDNSFELWSCYVVGYTFHLLVNREIGLLIESSNSMLPFDSHSVLSLSDFENCIKRFKETGKFGLKCRKMKGYYSVSRKNEAYDVEI